MPTDTDDLEHMRDLGINYVLDTVSDLGVDSATKMMRAFCYGMASSLAILNGERPISEFLYLMADHFAVHGMSNEDYERIGQLIKTANQKS